MTGKNWKAAVIELGKLVGRREAMRLLVIAKISPHTADKMLRGAYPSRPRPKMVSKIVRILEELRNNRVA